MEKYLISVVGSQQFPLQITRLCQDQYMTTILDYEDYGNILSNILDGLSKLIVVFVELIGRYRWPAHIFTTNVRAS